MPKVAQKYLDVHPYKIIENGFHSERAQVSESIFALANEYMGIRGHFDEGISNVPSLRGSYFNGVYEYALEAKHSTYKGMIERTHFMVNSIDWVSCTIKINDDLLDLGVNKFKSFYRELDMTSGLLTRSFVYLGANGLEVKFCFKRFLSMMSPVRGYQEITIKTNKTIELAIDFHLDGDVLMWGKDNYFHDKGNFINDDVLGISLETLTTRQKVVSAMKILGPGYVSNEINSKKATAKYNYILLANEEVHYERYVVNIVDRRNDYSFDEAENMAMINVRKFVLEGSTENLLSNKRFYHKVYENSDIEIVGDEANQQGIRYTLFQLTQTYHGYEAHNNIGAKGLTGEAYSGHAFWDSETYCLPFYLFNNPNAAKNLLMFRYNTLTAAKERAHALDCLGACYPIATLSGEEGSDLWQHASLQQQPSTAVAYAIFHYVNVVGDEQFLLDYGLEMLIEISRFLYSRGDYNGAKTHFGFYGVMGPDEFQLMVNHNTYTNYMAKKTFEYLEHVLTKFDKHQKVALVKEKTNFTEEERSKFNLAAKDMLILYDEETKLYEQHQGYYDLPNLDPKTIPLEDFPLYHHWSYDRIYRNNLIKQPDVLMFMFLYSNDFTSAQKRANYDFYEPKTIHESSLSPSIHSIFASELGYEAAALNFFGFATRMDLDDYNRNTREGLHTTSIAASWMNIVYGFGGLRSDGKILSLNPTIPSIWQSYTFNFLYQGQHIKVSVTHNNVEISNHGKQSITLVVYGNIYELIDKLSLKRGND